MPLIALHATEQEMALIEELKCLFHRRSNSDLLRFLITEGKKILSGSVSIETTPSGSPAVGSVVHGRVWTDREARALEEARRNTEACPPPKHSYVENPYK